MAKKKLEVQPNARAKQSKTVTQKQIARAVYNKLRGKMTLAEIEEIISAEENVCMNYLKKGYRVVKKNFLTLIPKIVPAKTWVSPLNQKTYELPEKFQLAVRVGEGLKKKLVI